MNNVTTDQSVQVLQWHPRFQVYKLNQPEHPEHGVVLIGDDTFYWLPEVDFPALHLVNGTLATQDISATISHALTRSTFLYQIEQLQEQALLINCQSEIFHDYTAQEPQHIQTLLQRSRLTISALSSVAPNQLTALAEFLSDGLFTATRPAPLHILLVDDFLHPAIAHFMAPLPHTVIVKISGEQLWISPLHAKTEIAQPDVEWRKLQLRLQQNQPLRQWLSQVLPEQSHSLPVNISAKAQLSQTTQHNLLRLIHQQLVTTSQHLVLLHRTKPIRESHPVEALAPLQASPRNALITLQDSAIQFNTDGGSRTCMPMETLAKLTPLVSSITGIISHLKTMDTPANDLLSGEVKIYQTGYHKLVSPRKPFFGESSTEVAPFMQLCMGKGVSPIQSQVSALSEAIERYSAMYADDLPDQITKPELLPARHISYAAIYPVTEAQTQTGNPFCQQLYNGEVISWTQIWSLTHHEPVYVPQSVCFNHAPLEENQFGRWHSNGCAAGNTLEEALLQALLELIERDAVAIWWYNKVVRPPYDAQNIDADNLAPLHAALAPHHDYWLLDLTTDIGIPTMAAIGQNRDTQGYIMGFGCHLNSPMAAQRALTELCQLIPVRDQQTASFNFDAIKKEDWLHPNARLQAAEYTPYSAETASIKTELTFVINRLAKLGYESLALDYQRQHLPLEVAKVFVPGLCHIWPQLANHRLYQVPVKMSWLAEARNQETINTQPLFV